MWPLLQTVRYILVCGGRRAAWWRRAAAATHGDRPAKFLRETEKFSTDRLAKAWKTLLHYSFSNMLLHLLSLQLSTQIIAICTCFMSEERKGVVSLNSVCLTNILNLSFQEKGLTNWFQNQFQAIFSKKCIEFFYTPKHVRTWKGQLEWNIPWTLELNSNTYEFQFIKTWTPQIVEIKVSLFYELFFLIFIQAKTAIPTLN